MPGESNAIRAGQAYVELFAKNNLKPGIEDAKKDISSLTTASGAAAAAGLSSQGQVGLASDAAGKSIGKVTKQWEDHIGRFAKLAAVGAVAIKGFGSAISAWAKEQEIALQKAGEQLDYFLERLGKAREKRAGLADVGTAPARREQTLSALNEELGTRQEILKRLEVAEARLNRVRAQTTKTVGGQKFDLSEIPILGAIASARIQVEETKVENIKKELKASIQAADELADKIQEIDLQAADPTKSIASKQALDSLRSVTDGFDLQRKSVTKTAEQMQVLTKQFEMLREFGPGASQWIGRAMKPLLDDATRTSTFLAQFNLQKSIRDIQDELYWKGRQAMLSLSGGTKGAFGSQLGRGTFEFGGGGPWAGIGITLKDMLEADLRIERAIYETNREIRRFGGDTAQ